VRAACSDSNRVRWTRRSTPRSLRALTAQTPDDEIIVVDSSSDGTVDIVRRFDRVRLLHFDTPLTVPELRGRGIAQARGAVIAILDPFSIVTDGWRNAIVQAHAGSRWPVIGGAVELRNDRARSHSTWALYINEYGMFMPPVRAGAADLVPGCNVSYKRNVLFDGDRPRFEVFWKTFVNWDVQAAGTPLWLEPNAVVELVKPIPLWSFFLSRFDHGRCFAGMRAAAWSRGKRLIRAVLAPVLPPLLLWRWSRVYWAKRRHRRRLIETLPLQMALFAMWAVGEACGYARGSGASCRRLFY
jgi:hypothetical protein